MDEYELFNRPINIPAASQYIKKHGMVMSTAVEANAIAAQNCFYMYNFYQEHMGNMGTEAKIKETWEDAVNQAQNANAFCWMMVQAAIEEKKQGWRYVEDGNDYIKKITDNGVQFTQDQRDKISMIRYFSSLYSRASNKQYVRNFKLDNLQYWQLKLKDLEKKEAQNNEKSSKVGNGER